MLSSDDPRLPTPQATPAEASSAVTAAAAAAPVTPPQTITSAPKAKATRAKYPISAYPKREIFSAAVHEALRYVAHDSSSIVGARNLVAGSVDVCISRARTETDLCFMQAFFSAVAAATFDLVHPSRPLLCPPPSITQLVFDEARDLLIRGMSLCMWFCEYVIRGSRRNEDTRFTRWRYRG